MEDGYAVRKGLEEEKEEEGSERNWTSVTHLVDHIAPYPWRSEKGRMVKRGKEIGREAAAAFATEYAYLY